MKGVAFEWPPTSIHGDLTFTFMPRQTNETLFARFRANGDVRSFNELFERLLPVLTRQARRLGFSRSDVDDLVQNTLVVALCRADQFDASRSLERWLRGILLYEARAIRRQNGKVLAQPGVQELSPDSLVEVQAAELRQHLERSLQGLPRRYREVIQLHYGSGLSPKEIAESLGRSPSTVRTQIHRGLQHLREVLPPGLVATLLGMLALQGRGTAQPAALARAPKTLLSRPNVLSVTALLVAAAIPLGWVLPARGVSAPVAAPVLGDRIARLDGPAVQSEPMAPMRRVAVAPALAPHPTGVRVRLVHAKTREPVPEVTFGLQARGRSLPTETRASFDGLQVARTDASGVAHFPAVRRGMVVLRFDGGFRTAKSRDASTGVVEVEVTRVASITGTVTDEHGAPVAGAQIHFAELGLHGFSPGLSATHSRSDGKFDLSVVGSGRVDLWASVSEVGRSRIRRLRLRPAVELVRPLVLLPASGRLSGTILDTDGRPVEDALVSVFPQRNHRAMGQASCYARSATDGGFAIDTLVAGRYFAVALGADGTRAATEFEADLQVPSAVTLRLSRGGTIAGRVVDEFGRGLPGLTIVAKPTPAREGRPAGKLLVSVATTRHDGSYELARVAPGPSTLQVVDRGQRLLLAHSRIDLAEGDRTWWSPVAHDRGPKESDGPGLNLPWSAEEIARDTTTRGYFGCVRGTVDGSEGTIASGFRLVLEPIPNPHGKALTTELAAARTFDFGAVPCGAYRLSLVGDKAKAPFHEVELAVRAGDDEPVSIRVSPRTR